MDIGLPSVYLDPNGRPPADELIVEAADAFRTAGCLVVHDVLDVDLVESLRRAFLARHRRYLAERNHPDALKVGGRRYMVITPDGLALPCHMARSLQGRHDLSFANVKDISLDTIWHESPAFARFRGDEWMSDPCRSCSRRSLDHGGCRCQAFHLTGNPAATDPACHLAPSHGLIEAARLRAETLSERPATLHYRRGIACPAESRGLLHCTCESGEQDKGHYEYDAVCRDHTVLTA